MNDLKTASTYIKLIALVVGLAMLMQFTVMGVLIVLAAEERASLMQRLREMLQIIN